MHLDNAYMNALRQIVSPQNGRLWIDLPKEYQQKRYEVIVLPIDEPSEKEQLQLKMAQFLDTLPADEPALTEAEIMAEIEAVRATRYAR